jgi:transposase-like protein
MAHGPKAIVLESTSVERGALEDLIRRRKVGQRWLELARVVLACVKPQATSLGVARALGVSWPAVAMWRRRFALHRLEGLVDASCSGAPRQIIDQAAERLIALTQRGMHFTLTRASLDNLLAVASLEIGSMASCPWMAQLGRLLVRPADPAAARGRRVDCTPFEPDRVVSR